MSGNRDDESAAHAEAARQRVERTAAYLRRGRALADRSDGELEAIWTAAMRAWAEAPSHRPCAAYDAEAEFAIRGGDPPYALARDEIGRLAAAAMDEVAGMTDAERRARGERILHDHLDERARQN